MATKQYMSYYKKFPVILQSKLINGELTFPSKTKFIYEPILAYRVICRDKDDYSPVRREDLNSYYENKIIPRGCNVDRGISYYSASLYKSFDMLKQSFKFPRPSKKLARGYVHMKGGPQYTDRKTHIDWWLYENAEIDGFEIIKGDCNYE